MLGGWDGVGWGGVGWIERSVERAREAPGGGVGARVG